MDREHNFNSIKVQLELLERFRENKLLVHFNSIKVQLEREHRRAGEYGTAFQFHKGTIRTMY